MNYHYRVLDVEDLPHLDLQMRLNRLAEEGWRVVTSGEGTVILERWVTEQMYAIYEPGGEPRPMVDPNHVRKTPRHPPIPNPEDDPGRDVRDGGLKSRGPFKRR